MPQSIARTALDDKVAILSDNAGEDTRFGGQSILMQQSRSAICAPLIGSEDARSGVLYVDNVTAHAPLQRRRFRVPHRFAGIAAVAHREQPVRASAFSARRWCAATSSASSRRSSRRRSPASANQLKLGGDKRTVAVLFSDIRGFTALSETMQPDDMATLLTEYFTEMVECVFRHDGTLDKFIGDAVMAQWGAPIGGRDDADKRWPRRST